MKDNPSENKSSRKRDLNCCKVEPDVCIDPAQSCGVIYKVVYRKQMPKSCLHVLWILLRLVNTAENFIIHFHTAIDCIVSMDALPPTFPSFKPSLFLLVSCVPLNNFISIFISQIHMLQYVHIYVGITNEICVFISAQVYINMQLASAWEGKSMWRPEGPLSSSSLSAIHLLL